MFRRFVISSLVSLAAATGCGGGHAPDSGHAKNSVSRSAFDRAFIDAMVPHHRQAVAMAREARDAGLSAPDLLIVASNIIDSQQEEVDRMLTWRNEWYAGEPADPGAAHALGMSDAEMGMHAGPELTLGNVNEVFADQMLVHHRGAIRMAARAVAEAQHRELRTLAEQIITAQEAELQVLRLHTGAMH
jgi:uncharacterized protein (DUF305 family)